VDPVPDPLLLRKSGSAGNRTRDPFRSYLIQVLSVNVVAASETFRKFFHD
jgi:hypothetical protein